MGLPNSSILDKSHTDFRKGGTGFTLIEVIIVMSLLTIIGGLVTFANFDVWRGYNFRGEYDLLIAVLQKARSQSINNICLGISCTEGQSHGVKILPDKYTIFQGTTYDPSDPLNEDFEASGRVSHSGISEVVFRQLSGDVDLAGDIILNEIDGFRSETIFINNEGRISW
jgi:prepilin-type N-terminal cleavage/methylation domain-containing protein